MNIWRYSFLSARPAFKTYNDMTKTILRILVLVLLTAAAAVALLSSPHDSSATWWQDLLLSKAIGSAAVYAAFRLYRRWRKTDPLIAAYDRYARAE